MENEERSIRISKDLWRKLMKIKLDLDCKSISEVIEGLLKKPKTISKNPFAPWKNRK